MIKKIKLITSYIMDVVWLLYLIVYLTIKKRIVVDKIDESSANKIIVLANGPSLKDELSSFKNTERSNIDFIALNYFANDHTFFEIKPKDYCLADPMFFRKTHREKEALELLKLLQNKVNWKMNIYIPSDLYSDFMEFSVITNKFIRIIRVNTRIYKGKNLKIKHYLYDKGLSTPLVSTVAVLAIFIALKKNISTIELYGVDHTFFDNLIVNDENQVCRKETHFYDNKSILKPLLKNENDEVFLMSEYVFMIGNMFKSHDELASYARYLNLLIINKTKGSLIDSYLRK